MNYIFDSEYNIFRFKYIEFLSFLKKFFKEAVSPCKYADYC